MSAFIAFGDFKEAAYLGESRRCGCDPEFDDALLASDKLVSTEIPGNSSTGLTSILYYTGILTPAILGLPLGW